MLFPVSSTKVFRMYLNCFQLLGLCPVVFSHSKKLNFNVLMMISLFHIIILTSIAIFGYAYSGDIFYDNDSFGQFNDIIKFVVVIIAYYAIIIESFVKRETQSKIWYLLARSHQTDRLDEIEQWKLWNCKEFNNYFLGLYCSHYSQS